MERLRRKLQSQSGASILMTLLLLLLCMMVSAAVVSAAVSNAGKARSNRVEQQKYLALSSAVRLVAEKLQEAKYWGRYEVYEWTVVNTATATNPDGTKSVVSNETEYFRCVQLEGKYQRASVGDPSVPMDPPNPTDDLTVQIPLGAGLDGVFSEQFIGRGGESLGYTPLGSAPVEVKHVVTVTLPNGLAGYSESGIDVYKVPKVVSVGIDLDATTQHITLTAWLGTDAVPPADKSDTMIAELVAKEGTIPILDYDPGSRMIGNLPIPGNESGGDAVTETKTEVTVTKNGIETYAGGAPLSWELNWIKKGGA